MMKHYRRQLLALVMFSLMGCASSKLDPIDAARDEAFKNCMSLNRATMRDQRLLEGAGFRHDSFHVTRSCRAQVNRMFR